MNRVIPLLVAAACLAACGGTSSTTARAPTVVAPPPMSVNFTAFLTTLVPTHSETAAPVSITNAEFVFTDDNNPGAFASVLSGP